MFEGVPTGALLTKKPQAQELVAPLRRLNWLKSVTGLMDSPEILAVHVVSKAAAAIERFVEKQTTSDDSIGLSCQERDFLVLVAKGIDANVFEWIPNIRIRSSRCVFRGGKVDCSPYKSVPEKVVRFDNQGVSHRFSFIELFAGIGGFRLAMDSLGGRSVFASEINDAARMTYVANFGREVFQFGETTKSLLVGDITEIDASDIPDHDILTAGFPCQSFCKVGSLTALDDSRGELFFEVVRVLKRKKPKAFLLENVANLVTMDEGRVFSTIKSHIECVGYTIHHKIIDAAGFVPQTRNRVYIVGFLSTAHSRRFEFPTYELPHPVLRSVLHPCDAKDLDSLFLTSHQLSKISDTHSYKKNPQWRIANANGLARTLMASYRTGYAMYSEFVSMDSPSPNESRSVKRKLSHTDSNSATTIEVDATECRSHKGALQRLRFYSTRECARIMGFPETFRLDAHPGAPGTLYHQLGNAVVPPVIEAIGREMLHAMGMICKKPSET